VLNSPFCSVCVSLLVLSECTVDSTGTEIAVHLATFPLSVSRLLSCPQTSEGIEPSPRLVVWFAHRKPTAVAPPGGTSIFLHTLF